MYYCKNLRNHFMTWHQQLVQVSHNECMKVVLNKSINALCHLAGMFLYYSSDSYQHRP